MKKINQNIRKKIALFMAIILALLSTATLPVFSAESDITYLSPVYGTDGKITFANDGNVAMEARTLAWGTYSTVSSSTTVMGTTDTSATPDANSEYWYVVSATVSVSNPIIVSGKVNLILCDGVTMTSEELTVSEGNELTIFGQEKGTGTLKIDLSSNSKSAGIGGSAETPNAGKITINGGTVNAKAASNGGAGIGGSSGGNGGEITINGGTVTAKGSIYYGAGIGGGNGGSGGVITINGGTISANAGGHSAAIGGSSTNNVHGSSGNITINGGNVTATPNNGDYSVGIGTSRKGKLDSITINGGTVTASGYTAAAIGTAQYTGTDNGKININGGRITATVVKNAAPAIGNYGTGTVDISITGGYIEATGGVAAAGIGGGANADSGKINISGGTIIAKAGTCTGSSKFAAAGIGGGGSTSSSNAGGIGYVTITGGYIEAYSSGDYKNTGGAGIGGGRMNYGVVAISGGCIIAEGGPDADGIGGGAGREPSQLGQISFSGTIEGSGGNSAVTPETPTPDIGYDPGDSEIQSSGGIIFTTSIPDMSEAALASYTGIICIKYGKTLAYSPNEYVFTDDFTIPADYTLEINAGESLVIAGNATLILNGAIVNNGTLTLKNGTTITGSGAMLATKEDNSFTGWYTDEELTIPFDSFDTPIKEDITLYPKFEEGTTVVNVEIQGVNQINTSKFFDKPGKQTYSGTPMVYVTDDFGTRYVSLEYEVEYFSLQLNDGGEVISRTPMSQSVRWIPGTYETVLTVIDNENDGFDYQGQLSWRTVVDKCDLKITPKNQAIGTNGLIADNLFTYSATLTAVNDNSIVTATLTLENGTIYASNAKVIDHNGIDITEYYNAIYETGTAIQVAAADIENSTIFSAYIDDTTPNAPYKGLLRKIPISIAIRDNNRTRRYIGSDFEISVLTEGLKGIYIDGNNLVITSEFSQNASDSTTTFNKSVKISVTYTNGDFSKTVETTIKITWDEPTANRIAVYKNGEEITSDSLDVTEGATATYTAKVLDQYGYEIAGQTVIWAESKVDGVTMSNGTLTAERATETKNEVFTITAGALSVYLPIEFVGEGEQEHTCDHTSSMICPVCGELAPLSFYGWSLTLYDNIALNYAVDARFFADGCYTNPSVTFTIGDRTVTVTEYNTTKYAGYYIFTLTDIAPHQMGMTVSATLSANDGETLITTDAAEYSIKTYCYNKLNNENTSAELKTLIVDLLNYGAATQTYVGSSDALVNADLTDEQKALGTQGDVNLQTVAKSNYQTVENATVTWAGAYLTLTDAVEMKFVFNAATTDGLTVKVTTADPTDAEAVGHTWYITTFEAYGDGMYIANFDGFNADQMSDIVYVTVCDEEGNALSNTYRYSIESYAYAKSNDSNADLAALVKAMMNYGNSAKNYNS